MDICVISGFPLLRIKPLVNPHVLVSVFSSSHKQLEAETFGVLGKGMVNFNKLPKWFPSVIIPLSILLEHRSFLAASH